MLVKVQVLVLLFFLGWSSGSSSSSNKSTGDTTFTQGKARPDLAAPQLSQTLPLFQTIGIFVNTSRVINLSTEHLNLARFPDPLAFGSGSGNLANLNQVHKKSNLNFWIDNYVDYDWLIADPLISSLTIIAITTGISRNKYYYYK